MIYGLARYSSEFVDISAEEYKAIKSAQEKLFEVLFIEVKFDLVIENYLELEKNLLEIAADHMVLGNLNYDRFQNERNLVNRRLLNLLSSCRSYLDQAMHHLHNIFGNESETPREIKDFIKYQYSQCLGYRVMEALRNYVQHRGSATHGIIYNSKWVESESGKKLLYSVTVYLKPDKLREDGKFKKAVLGELKASGGEVDIKPLIRDYIASLGSVHKKIRTLLKSDVHNWTHSILSAMDRFQARYPEEQSIVGLEAVLKNDDGKYSQRVPLFGDFIEYGEQLERKNSNLTNLGKRYVSSEVS